MIDEADALAAWELAPVHCLAEHGCLDYHRVWGLLRLLLPAKPLFGEDTIVQGVRSLSSGNGRILLCGAADTAVLKLILEVGEAMDCAPMVDVIERCASACEVLRLHAARRGSKVNVIQGDFSDAAQLSLPSPTTYDLVIAHNILGLIPGEFRQAVCANWASLSARGSTLLLVQTLCASDVAWLDRNRPRDVDSALATLLNGLRSRDVSEQRTNDILTTAQRFWQATWRQSPALTEASVKSLLSTAGFSTTQVHYDACLERGPSSASITTRSGHSRALFMAVRRRHVAGVD